MARLSDITNPIFREYTPILNRVGIELDLDLKNPITEVKNPKPLEFELKKYLEFTTVLQATSDGNLRTTDKRIVISDRPHQVIIKDHSAVLSPEQRQLLTSDTTSIKSRVGFGTTVTIDFLA